MLTEEIDTKNWNRQKVQKLLRPKKGQFEENLCPIYSHRHQGKKASKSLWETSAKSGGESRQLAEEAVSFTEDLVENQKSQKWKERLRDSLLQSNIT